MKIAIPILTVILAAILSFSAYKIHKKMVDKLPPVERIYAYEVDEMLRKGYPMIAILGTGSMQPYLPAGEGIVAWAVLENCDYDLLGEGDLIVYHHNGINILHQLSLLTDEGWIASGLHNVRYDYARVTREMFRGRVVKTFILIQ